MAVITAVLGTLLYGCLLVGAGCVSVMRAVWAFLGENQTVVSASLSGF